MSSLKESEEQTSPPGGVPSPAPAPSRGEHVANSHFSKTRASSGKSGCLGEAGEKVHEGRPGACGGRSTWEKDRRPRGRDGEIKTARESQRHGRGGPHPESCPHSPIDLVLLPPQAITVQARGLGLGRPVWAIGPGGSRCRGHCLREASQGCSAVHDAWVVRQLIVLGGRREGESPREASGNLPTLAPRRCSPCPQEPALSFPVSEPSRLGPRMSHGAVSLELRALSQGLPLYPWSVKMSRQRFLVCGQEGPEERD